MPNFVTNGQTVAEIWRFFDISKWRPLPSWVFKILIFLSVVKVKEIKLRHRAKFGGERSNHC